MEQDFDFSFLEKIITTDDIKEFKSASKTLEEKDPVFLLQELSATKQRIFSNTKEQLKALKERRAESDFYEDSLIETIDSLNEKKKRTLEEEVELNESLMELEEIEAEIKTDSEEVKRLNHILKLCKTL